MAFQSVSKMRRTGSPSSNKTGPMKAIQTFGLTKGTNVSPTAQLLGIDAQNQANFTGRRLSPDNVFYSGSPVPRERKSFSHGGSIRRTGSFDMISSNSYLNGEWPRFGFLSNQTSLTCEKYTQTPDEWHGLLSSDHFAKKLKVTSASPSGTSDGSKDIRPYVKPGKEKPSVHRNSSFSHGISTLAIPAKTLPISFRERTACHCRGSLEGLNQEIEKLVMHNNLMTDRVMSPADGRRAPVAHQLNTCSRVTQTPTGFVVAKMNRTESDGSLKDYVHEDVDDCDIKVFKESPECLEFHSPKAVNGRLPPDGCEKVQGKFKEIQENKPEMVQIQFCDQPVIQYHIPSELSAFNPLVKNYLSQPVELAHQFTGLAIVQPRD